MDRPDSQSQPTYEVVSPLGAEQNAPLPEPAPLGSLNDRTIGFVWDYLFKGDAMFDVIRETIEARYSGTRFVDHEQFGNVHGSAPDERANVAAIAARIREAQIDAVVVAVGA